MKRQVKISLKSFLLELVVYSALVALYYFLVLHFLGDWLNNLFHTDRRTYAGVALGFILAQGLVLELLTRWLLGLIQPQMEDE